MSIDATRVPSVMPKPLTSIRLRTSGDLNTSAFAVAGIAAVRPVKGATNASWTLLAVVPVATVVPTGMVWHVMTVPAGTTAVRPGAATKLKSFSSGQVPAKSRSI